MYVLSNTNTTGENTFEEASEYIQERFEEAVNDKEKMVHKKKRQNDRTAEQK